MRITAKCYGGPKDGEVLSLNLNELGTRRIEVYEAGSLSMHPAPPIAMAFKTLIYDLEKWMRPGEVTSWISKPEVSKHRGCIQMIENSNRFVATSIYHSWVWEPYEREPDQPEWRLRYRGERTR